MRKVLMVGGAILALVIVLNLASNIPNKPEVQKNTTIVAKKAEKLGNSWYVNDIMLDRSFKRGFSKPEVGDSIDLGLDDKGRVVDWKINN